MLQEEFESCRKKYNYPPARLILTQNFGDGTRDDKFVQADGYRLVADPLLSGVHRPDEAFLQQYSSVGLDAFHSQLLNGDNAEMLHGFYSAIFWGYASGKDGILRQGRAFARAKWLVNGRKGGSPPQKIKEVLNILRVGRDFVRSGQLGDALIEFMNLQGVGLAFASKLVMFSNPQVAAVYDSVIDRTLQNHSCEELRNLKFDMTGASPQRRKVQKAGYLEWCRYCAKRADQLNTANSAWIDWDGTQHSWRAVDVERAIFASPAGVR